MAEKQDNTEDLLKQLLDAQAAHRQEIAELRDEINKSKAPRLPVPTILLSADELVSRRMEEIEQHSYYCPGCGRLYDRERECTGSGEAPHPTLEVVSTDELKSGDASKHTAAPGVNP